MYQYEGKGQKLKSGPTQVQPGEKKASNIINDLSKQTNSTILPEVNSNDNIIKGATMANLALSGVSSSAKAEKLGSPKSQHHKYMMSPAERRIASGESIRAVDKQHIIEPVRFSTHRGTETNATSNN